MLMDIACPAELLRAEQAQFGDGRRQAYLTFLNETDKTIIEAAGRMTLLNADGSVVEHRQVAFDGLSAPPGEKFTYHLALDGFPQFEQAEVSLEYVGFLDGEPWALNTRRLMDCIPPPLPDGPKRVALIALAGHDAVCFPEKRDSLWICVCGRYNRWRWLACRRCGRGRDDTFDAFDPERVVKDYQQAVEEIRARDQHRLIEKAAEVKVKKTQQKVRVEKRKREVQWEKRIIAVAAAVLGLSLLLWGAMKLIGTLAPPPAETQVDSQEEAMPPIDYLDTI